MGHTNQGASHTALLALAALLLISAHSSAQSIQGSTVGTVTDATGAGVPNVKVTAMNERTSFARSTQTNESGLYELPNLEPSEYTIKAEASGFTVEGQGPVVRTEDAKIDSGMTFWNSSLFKEFRFHERARLRIGCQSQTTFNWLSLGTPNGDITSPNGFRATGSAKGTPAGRNLEFAGRISF